MQLKMFHDVLRLFACDCVLQITSGYEAYLAEDTDFKSLYGAEIEYAMEDSIEIKYEEGELAVYKCRPGPGYVWQTADAAIRKARLRNAVIRKGNEKNIR